MLASEGLGPLSPGFSYRAALDQQASPRCAAMALLSTYAAQLPQELIDYTIDYVALSRVDAGYSKESLQTDLASCSLVARSWVARSSRYLLEHTGIGAVRNAERKRVWKAPEDALQFLQSSPRLQTHIRKLSFRGPIDLPVYLDSFFAILPRLHALELNGPSPERYSPLPFAATFAPRHALNRLSLSGLEIWCIPRVLRLFKSISTLELSPWCSILPVELVPGTYIPPVDHLVLKYSGHTGVDVIADSLRQLFRPRSVVCTGLPSHMLDVFCRFLTSAGENVEELTLAPMLYNYSVEVGMVQSQTSSHWVPSFEDTFIVERSSSFLFYSHFSARSRLHLRRPRRHDAVDRVRQFAYSQSPSRRCTGKSPSRTHYAVISQHTSSITSPYAEARSAASRPRCAPSQSSSARASSRSCSRSSRRHSSRTRRPTLASSGSSSRSCTCRSPASSTRSRRCGMR